MLDEDEGIASARKREKAKERIIIDTETVKATEDKPHDSSCPLA